MKKAKNRQKLKSNHLTIKQLDFVVPRAVVYESVAVVSCFK